MEKRYAIYTRDFHGPIVAICTSRKYDDDSLICTIPVRNIREAYFVAYENDAEKTF